MKRSDLCSMLAGGLSIRKIAAARNTSYTNVRYWIRKHGLSPNKVKRGRSCKCGETDPLKFYARPRSTCMTCHNKYSHGRQIENKKWAVQIMGGKCKLCGYSKCIEALDFHHIDPSVKDGPNGNAAIRRGWSKKRIAAEISKCILVCTNCHREIHSGLHKALVVQRMGSRVLSGIHAGSNPAESANSRRDGRAV